METIVKKKDYWVCDRCEINSKTKDRMIPCPRGGCEADVKGEIIITEELRLFPEDISSKAIILSNKTI